MIIYKILQGLASTYEKTCHVRQYQVKYLTSNLTGHCFFDLGQKTLIAHSICYQNQNLKTKLLTRLLSPSDTFHYSNSEFLLQWDINITIPVHVYDLIYGFKKDSIPGIWMLNFLWLGWFLQQINKECTVLFSVLPAKQSIQMLQ